MIKSTAKWIDKYKVEVNNERGHSISMDLPLNQMGNDTAASPLEYMVMGYAGCTVTMFKIIADKMHLEIDGIEVKVEAQKTDEIQTISELKSISIVKTSEPMEKVQKALKNALSMCPVGRIYEKAQIPAETKLIVSK